MTPKSSRCARHDTHNRKRNRYPLSKKIKQKHKFGKWVGTLRSSLPPLPSPPPRKPLPHTPLGTPKKRILSFSPPSPRPFPFPSHARFLQAKDFALDAYVSSLVQPLLDVERTKKTKRESFRDRVTNRKHPSALAQPGKEPAAATAAADAAESSAGDDAVADDETGGIFATALPMLDRLESAKEGLHRLGDATSSQSASLSARAREEERFFYTHVDRLKRGAGGRVQTELWGEGARRGWKRAGRVGVVSGEHILSGLSFL